MHEVIAIATVQDMKNVGKNSPAYALEFHNVDKSKKWNDETVIFIKNCNYYYGIYCAYLII